MMVVAATIARNIMERFLERHQGRTVGILSGFDRVLFRGTLRSISHLTGMDMFLSSQRVLYKDFGAYVNKLSEQLKDHAAAIAQRAGRPLRYVASADSSKEEIARSILEQDQVREGLVCVLTCVEPCQTFSIRKDREKKLLRLVAQPRKCLHIYFYYVNRDFGLFHIRLQTWLPFPMQVCLNGREYLARQLTKAGIGYEQRDNSFVRIDDLPRAQAILDRLVTKKWPRWLRTLGRQHNPLVNAASGLRLHDYYWTLRQGEWATDVMFKDAAAVQEVYPTLVQHAIMQFSAQHVLRFLGRRTNARFNGDVRSELKHRPEGICVKHWVEENSIKMYDKHGSILRIETTINNPRRFRVRRSVTRKGRRCMAWVPMRKSVADIPRLVQVSQAANQRYLQALALVNPPQPVHQSLDPVSRRIIKDGRPYRALRPITSEEAAWFRILLSGAFRIQGFRNPQVRRLLFPAAEGTVTDRQRASSRVTRLFRLLRAHGLIQKVSGRRYYRVSDKGTQVMTTALQIRETNAALLSA
jgi:hypothetical protein